MGESGGISDLPSAKKIKSVIVGSLPNREPMQEKSRVRTVPIYTDQMLHNYASDLHTLAWAQAVWNKPREEVLVLKNEGNNNRKHNNSKPNDGNGVEVDNGSGVNESMKDKVVIDISSGDDEEEGELEEGEIDMSDSDASKLDYDLKGDDRELELRILSIREALENVTKNDLEESYDAVCFRIKNSLDNLWEVVLEDSCSKTDGLIELAYGAINTLNNMFGGMSQKQQEQNKSSLSRLLCNMTSQNPPIFLPEQMKEIESMIKSLVPGSSLPSLGGMDKQNIKNYEEEKTPRGSTKLETSSLEGRVLLEKSNKQNKIKNDGKAKTSTDFIKLETSSSSEGRWLLDETNKKNKTEIDNEAKASIDLLKVETSSLKNRELLKETNRQNKIEIDNEAKASIDLLKVKTNSLKNIGLLKETNRQNKIEINNEAKASLDLLKLETSSLKNRRLLKEINKQNQIDNNDEAKTSTEFTKLKINVLTSRGLLVETSKIENEETSSLDKGLLVETNEQSKIENEEAKTSMDLAKLETSGENINGFYQNDALKAVSTYQQKFGLNSFHLTDLPSPTPSQDSEDRIDDISKSVTKPILPQLNVSSSCEMNIFSTQAVENTKNTLLLKSAAKSRDPRLRFANARTVVSPVPIVDSVGRTTSTKNKSTDDFFWSGPILKRQKNAPTETSTSDTSSLASILREFDVDPVILRNVGLLQTPTPSASMDMEKIHLKPRDPRRALHSHPSDTICSSREVFVAPSSSQNTFGDVEHIFKGLDEKQKSAFHKMRARRIAEQKKMFAARKLCLVLDLDHTLLNSVKFSEIDPVHNEKLRKKEKKDGKHPRRHLFRIPHMGMWTKLRPGIWNFLEKASKLFELHLYTMGNKMYAAEMAKLLDPTGILFSGRVISRGDADDGPDTSKTKDLEGVLGMESGVLIIDDTIHVWPHNMLNLIVVERYIYFPHSRRQFGLSGPSLLEIGQDESPKAGTLASSLAVIERIHQNFFAHKTLEEADVRNILSSEQKKILDGCRIVFSRVFPVGEANPRRHPLWKTAEQFGAICIDRIDEHITHVVANSLGTQKVKWARANGKFVVRPGW